MAGNMGDIAAGHGGGGVWPDRVDLPFVVVTDPQGGARISETCFGHDGSYERHWSIEWRATALLAEFTDTDAWRNRAPRSGDGSAEAAANGLTLTPWTQKRASLDANLKARVRKEIKELVIAAETERADAVSEIISQHMTFVPHLMALLDASPASHPKTYLLINSAVLIAGFAGQHFKQISQRRRPGQVCPALNPPIPVPGHAAYPSGHSTQAHLCALSLTRAFGGTPALPETGLPGPAPDPELATRLQVDAAPALRAMAWRLARNREIAGVHYRSDTLGGRELAEKLFVALAGMPGYVQLLRDVNDEWA